MDKVLPLFKLLTYYFRYSVTGLENIPLNKASLVAMNHGIIPYHGFMLTVSCIEDLGLYPRGLGAGFLFDIPFVREFFLRGGAVNANPKNARQLLKEGNCVMLSPGGIYEALIARPDMDRIPWERRTGFVEMAVETQVPIVPSYAKGIDNAYFNSKFLLKLRIKILERTRFSMPLFAGLGLLPFPVKITQSVGKPISSHKRKGESIDEAVERIHAQVIQAMEKLRDAT